jgi:EasF-like predicted methyltransferase
VDYYALDLSLDELKRTLDKVPRYQYVRCRGLWGTYEDGLTWLNKPANREKPTWIMSMGSSMGNFSGDQAGSFLRDFARLLGPFDSMLIALDGSQDAEKVTPAYSANEPVSRAFYLNALDHANSVLGYKAFKRDEWDVTGYFSDGCYKSFFVPLKDITIEGVMLKRGEKIFFEQSCKYAEEDRRDLWRKAELSEQEKWGNPTGEYRTSFWCRWLPFLPVFLLTHLDIHLLSSARTHFPMHPNLYAATAVPSLPEFERLWHLWDAVTAMVPNAALYSKPIDLRNPIIFYLGTVF